MPEVCQWVPLADTDVTAVFDAPDGNSTFDGSTVTSTSANAWTLTLSESAKVRVTYADFLNTSDSEALPPAELAIYTSGFEFIAGVDAEVDGPALSGSLEDASVGIVLVEMQASEFPQSFEGAFLVEVEVCGPTPPPEPTDPGSPYRIRNAFRQYMGSDQSFTAWVRTEEGKLDMSALTLSVSVQRGDNELFTVDATSPEVGRVDFTITAAQAKNRLSLLSKFRLLIRGEYPDGSIRTLATGILEVVG